jgi:hypothetical protein
MDGSESSGFASANSGFFGANVLLASQSAAGAIQFHETGAEKGDSGLLTRWEETVALILKSSSLLLLPLLLCSFTHSPVVEAGSGTTDSSAATSTVKTIKNPGGGTIVYGPLSGQLTPRAALSETLKRIDNDYGDKPQLGKVLQNQAGTIWEGFFTVNNKKQGNAPMTGLVIVYAPKSGTAGGATLIDTTANFPKSANSMLQSLVQQVTNNAKAAQNASQAGASSATANVASGPAQKLTPYIFPDGSGSIGLPPGWSVTHAQMGDVSAKGPSGEMLRFGLLILALDPNFPQSRTLTGGRNVAPGNYVLIPSNQEPATILQQALNQLAQKSRTQPPSFNFTQTKDLGVKQGVKNYMLYGDVDRHDGSGTQSTITEVLMSAPDPKILGSYQIKVFAITAPPQVLQQDAATIAEIFPNYSLNTQYVNAVATQGLQEIMAQQRASTAYFNQQMASTDLMSQGMSDLLRGEGVFTDSDTGMRYRGPDDLASALQNANPNRFQTVPLSQYIQGVDY